MWVLDKAKSIKAELRDGLAVDATRQKLPAVRESSHKSSWAKTKSQTQIRGLKDTFFVAWRKMFSWSFPVCVCKLLRDPDGEVTTSGTVWRKIEYRVLPPGSGTALILVGSHGYLRTRDLLYTTGDQRRENGGFGPRFLLAFTENFLLLKGKNPRSERVRSFPAAPAKCRKR